VSFLGEFRKIWLWVIGVMLSGVSLVCLDQHQFGWWENTWRKVSSALKQGKTVKSSGYTTGWIEDEREWLPLPCRLIDVENKVLCVE